MIVKRCKNCRGGYIPVRYFVESKTTAAGITEEIKLEICPICAGTGYNIEWYKPNPFARYDEEWKKWGK